MIKILRITILSFFCISLYISSTQISLAEQSTSPTMTLSSVSESPVTPAYSPWFYGGGIGAAFGDAKYIEVSPMVGYKINPKLSTGVSLLYRYGKNTLFKDSYTTTDYGATLFARYSLTPSFYLQAEYVYLDYESAVFDFLGNLLRTERDQDTSFFAGGGFSKPLGGNASMFITALYNFDYDENANPKPYYDPVTVQVGIGIGF